MDQTSASTKGVAYFVKNSRVYTQTRDESAQELFSVDTVTPGFKAQLLSVNTRGTLVAVASRNTIQIWLVDLTTRSARRISEAYEEDKLTFKSPVLSLKWHPSARGDAGLVVLTETQVVSLFFSSGLLASREFLELQTAESVPETPAGIGFGTELDPLSLYLGTADGDIYRITPFAPPEIELEEEDASVIDDLKSTLEAAGYTASFQSWSDSKSCKTWVFKRIAKMTFRDLKNYEPLRLTPYSTDMYDDDTLDVSVGNIGWGTDIVVQACTSRINIFALSRPVDSLLLDTLVLVSSLKYKRPQSWRRIEYIGPRWIFVSCESGTDVLDISCLSSAIENDDQSPIESSSSSSSVSAEQGQLPQQPLPQQRHSHKNIVKVSRYPKLLLYKTPENIVSAQTSDTWSLAKEPELEPVDTYLSESNKSSTRQHDRPQYIEGTYNADTTGAIEKLGKPSPAPLITNWGSNLASLDGLMKSSSEFNECILKLAKLVSLTDVERQAQTREATQQIDEIGQLKARAEKAVETTSQTDAKLSKLARRHTDLSKRTRDVASRVLAAHLKSAHLPSKQEEIWNKELKEELPAKLSALEPQIQQIRDSLAREKLVESEDKRAATRKPHDLTSNQILELQRRLQEQEKLISSLKSKLNLN